MKERRPLSEGLHTPAPPVDAETARKFIHGEVDVDGVNGNRSTARQSPPTSATPFARVPLSTRIRSEYAEALKRASLERQLEKQEPNTLQDILEQAIEPWLKSNGYIK